MILTLTYLLLLAFGGLTFNSLIFAPVLVLDFMLLLLVAGYLGMKAQ